MPKFELTNMIMIKDRNRTCRGDRQNKKPWAFSPRGHIEDDKSFYDSAVREAYEETGLKVKNLKHCGVIHWLNTDTKDRYIVFLYKTSEFEGELKEFSDEGKNKWVSVEELLSCKAETRMPEYMPMFLNDDLNEAFGPWRENEDFSIYYK